MTGLFQWSLTVLAGLGAGLSIYFPFRHRAKYKCDCGHSLSFHDQDGCNKTRYNRSENPTCECVQYVGKRPEANLKVVK